MVPRIKYAPESPSIAVIPAISKKGCPIPRASLCGANARKPQAPNTRSAPVNPIAAKIPARTRQPQLAVFMVYIVSKYWDSGRTDVFVSGDDKELFTFPVLSPQRKNSVKLDKSPPRRKYKTYRARGKLTIAYTGSNDMADIRLLQVSPYGLDWKRIRLITGIRKLAHSSATKRIQVLSASRTKPNPILKR